MPKKKSVLNHPKGTYVFKKNLDKLTMIGLRKIAGSRKDLFKGHSKYRRKGDLLRFMKSKMTGSKIMIKAPEFIDIPVDSNVTDVARLLAKESFTEYSVAMDFETPEEPQKIILIKGERYQTVKVDGFDLFMHTHPVEINPYPSASDIYTMELYRPELLIGRTGRMIIFNIEDYDRYKEWIKKNKDKGINDAPFQLETLRIDTRRIRDKKGAIMPKYKQYLLRDRNGRDIFFRETGVRIYPYRKGMKLKIEKGRILLRK